ncbi:hypothetical protein MNBD_IGNAVI01-686 [hydrothermal vent metagenome]|uniref:Uncharacterized protein n=1 Tax=hydrothermal vent metagenome TaxID=652676 RepID=A0A3B1CF60_9ZZZZ
MITILDQEKYDLHLNKKSAGNYPVIYELLLSILLFGSIGAITWAIRGTAGWGGVDGTVIPGLMWGVLWYYLAYRKGTDARGVVLWLGLGIALGGELGYGQYVSWIRGIFYAGDKTIPIEPWLGYIWLILCGIGWAAPGGILLGWALGKRVSTKILAIRSLTLVILLVLLFGWSVIDWLGELLLKTESSFLFPNIDLGLYTADLGKHLSRTVYTNTQNIAVVVWWIAALLAAAWQRDKTTLVTGLILGVGFGLGFMQSALWTLGYASAPNYIDWWKMWELNSGFNLGLLYAVTFYWAIRNVDKTDQSNKIIADKTEVRTKYLEWRDTLFLAFGGFLLLFFVGFEYFFWTGLALSVFYFAAMILTTVGNSDSNSISEKRRNISLIYSIFFLVFLLFFGASERLGIVLDLYSLDEVSQYSWPINRILLFIPIAIVIISVAIFKMWQILRSKDYQSYKNNKHSKQALLVIDLMTVIGFIGALTIWPEKIGILYALFLVFAIYAFNRLEHRFDMVFQKNNWSR